jgi:phospholipid transport system substrate-binding protein
MKRMSQFIATVVVIVVTLLSGTQAEAQEAPDALIRRISQEVVKTVSTDKAIQNGDRRQIATLVETLILPNVDFERTTALAAGRYWTSASPEQQKRLVTEFRALLIHTYSNAMVQVRDQAFEFKPLHADSADTEVEVHSHVMPARGAEPVQISYRLVKMSTGWKIYDVNIMGAWLIAAYKGTFNSILSQGGMDQLINSLAEKNRKVGTRTSS